MLFKKPSFIEDCYETYKKTLVSEFPAIKEDDKLYASPEHLFFYDRNSKKIRMFRGNKTHCVDEKYLMRYISKKSYSSGRRTRLFKCLYDYLMNISSQCVFGHEYPKYLCKVFENCDYPERIHFEDLDNNFINLNGIICYCNKNGLGVAVSGTPVTAMNFDNVLLKPWGYPDMSSSLKKRIIKNLKYLMLPIKAPNDFGVYDKSCNCVFSQKTKFVYVPNDSGVSIFGTKLPYSMQHGYYNFHDNTIEILRSMFNNDYAAFSNFAQFMFTAYSNILPIKKATIIVTSPKNNEAVTLFLRRLFLENIVWLNVYDLTDVTFQNTNPFVANFNNKQILLITNDPPINNFSRLRALVYSTYQRVTDSVSGMIKYKNTIPVMVITSDKEYANWFKQHINSNIISLEHYPLDKLIHPNDLLRLHQTLVFCGMRNISEKLTSYRAVRRLKDMTDKDIVSKFVKDYCSGDDKSVTSKLELRTAFKQFTDAWYPQYAGNSNAVCNLLRDMDYDGTHKTRLEKGKNPVAVFRGIYFNKPKFEIDIKSYNLEEVNKIPHETLDGFEKIMYEIYSTML